MICYHNVSIFKYIVYVPVPFPYLYGIILYKHEYWGAVKPSKWIKKESLKYHENDPTSNCFIFLKS